MTLLEILDTSIKIGLGALITGVIAYFNQKANISASTIKENLIYNRNLLTNISKDVEEINHLILKIWATFEFETKKFQPNPNELSDKLKPLRQSLFNDFNLLSKNEGLLLLHGYTEQQEKLRAYGELLGKFHSYSLFKNEDISSEKTNEYRDLILDARKELYLSLNKAIPK